MSDRLKEILAMSEVMVVDDHIIYTSGRHGLVYFDKDRIYLSPENTSWICARITEQIMGHEIVDSVIAPAVGGVALSQWVAYHLGIKTGMRVRSVFARKDENGSFVFKGSYPKEIKGKDVWVVEDVLNTGDSARKVIEAARAHGANVLGLSVLCNRGGLKAEDFDIKHLTSLLEIEAKTWSPKECPLCEKGIPINTQVGHGSKFLAEQKA